METFSCYYIILRLVFVHTILLKNIGAFFMSDFKPRPELEKLLHIKKQGQPFGQNQDKLVRPCRMAVSRNPMITIKDRHEQYKRLGKMSK